MGYPGGELGVSTNYDVPSERFWSLITLRYQHDWGTNCNKQTLSVDILEH